VVLMREIVWKLNRAHFVAFFNVWASLSWPCGDCPVFADRRTVCRMRLVVVLVLAESLGGDFKLWF
jgi:hypothetical protein